MQNHDSELPIKKRIVSPYLILLILLVITLVGLWLFYPYSIGSRQVISFRPDTLPHLNPFIGWAPWATSKNILQPHSLVYADLTWRDLEPEKGVYNFQGFEEKNSLEKWRTQGKRVVFRFLLDVPGKEDHLDIPDWLYEETGKDGVHYNLSYGKGYSPNYSHPTLIKAHQNVIKAIGDRYGQDDFFFYVELGSLGHWGEWHVRFDKGLPPIPKEAIRNEYVQHYINAFPNSFLLLRRPFNIAKQYGLGIYNDMTGDPEATEEWLTWINEGGDYSQTGEQLALSAMPEQWQIAPIGGEQTGSLEDVVLYEHALQQTLNLLTQSHASFIGPRGAYDIAPSDPLQLGIDEIIKTLGYRLYISQVNLPNEVLWGRNIRGKIEIRNEGIAPFYANWPLKIYLQNSDGDVIHETTSDFALRTILPASSKEINFVLPIKNLPPGEYRVGLAIIDPLTQEPAVEFAQTGAEAGSVFVVGSFLLK